MSEHRALAAAYRAARYLVLLENGPLELRVGVRDEAAEARLAGATGARHWALITPCNPRSVTLAAEENRRLYVQMREDLRPGIRPGYRRCTVIPRASGRTGRASC